MEEEKTSWASVEPQDDPFDLDIRVYALQDQDQTLLASGPLGSTMVGCGGHCIGSMLQPAE